VDQGEGLFPHTELKQDTQTAAEIPQRFQASLASLDPRNELLAHPQPFRKLCLGLSAAEPGLPDCLGDLFFHTRWVYYIFVVKARTSAMVRERREDFRLGWRGTGRIATIPHSCQDVDSSSGKKLLNLFRIALANLRFPDTPEESVGLAGEAIHEASLKGARIVCFPECFVPGYRGIGKSVPPADPDFLERAWAVIAEAAARAKITAILGTERFVDGGLTATALVIDPDGSIAGFQDKVQIDPSEEATYRPGAGRRIFQASPMTFGIAICHEGWRYPETVRWAARRGAQVVFHPHFHEAEPGSYRPKVFADPANTFHEKAILCRAAENTCYFATVNCASPGSPTTSAVVRPDGTLQSYQPYGEEGLLIADLDLSAATGLLASRSRTGS
jgi:predicted amidohydrolase